MSEQPRPDVDAANFRATIITSFLLGATMILLSLNATIIKGAMSSGFGTVEGLLAVSIALMLFCAMIMLFMSYVVLQTMYLAAFPMIEKMRRIAWARTLLGSASILIPTSFGSTFLVSLGITNSWSWVFGAIGYGSGISWALLRGYYLKKFVHPWMKSPKT